MSDKAHVNPYRSGSYHDIFAFIKQKQVVTRAEVLAFTAEKFGTAKPHDVTVILSPREESKRGDCRGNISACGHVYYMEKLARQVKAGVKEPQKFRLRWRATVLEPRKRIANLEVKAVKKAKKVAAKVETPAPTPAPTPAEDKVETSEAKE